MRQRQTAKASEGLVVSGYQTEEWSIGRMYKLTARLHQPNRLMTRPGTPAIAAEVAAPMRCCTPRLDTPLGRVDG